MATSRRFAAFLAEQLGDSGDQFVELGLSLRVAGVVEDATGRARWAPADEEEILRIGGRWDRGSRTWVGDTAQVAVIRITRGGAQERAARWLAGWFRAHVSGDWAAFNGDRARVWSVLLSGGRRSGKSHLACAALVLYALLYPAAVVFAVSPTQNETAELEKAVRSMLPAPWYTYRGSGAGKVSTFTLPHGGQILLLSGFKPHGLRRGRVDFCLFNEGQNMSHRGYVQLRAAIADTGGLVLIAANPPDAPIGRWVEDHQEGVAAKKIDGVQFEFNPEENPWVQLDALQSMAAEVDAVTYDRDVLGIFRPIGNVVFHAWQDRASKQDVPAAFVDCTKELTLAILGQAREWVVGMDFQATPAMVAVVIKFFRDPDDATRDVLTWIVGEVIAENANEDDLVTALECADRWTPTGYQDGAGYQGEECAVVMDASGFFQDGAHTRGRTSDLALRARGWKCLHRPQKDSDKNPDVIERIKIGNARLKTKDERRHLFVVPTCTAVARATKLWENRHGVPHRRAPQAHICDAWTYPVYRFFGRPKVKKPRPTYDRVRTSTRADDVAGL